MSRSVRLTLAIAWTLIAALPAAAQDRTGEETTDDPTGEGDRTPLVALERLELPGTWFVDGTEGRVVLDQIATSEITLDLTSSESLSVPSRVTVPDGRKAASFSIGVVEPWRLDWTDGWIQIALGDEILRRETRLPDVGLRLVDCGSDPPRPVAGEAVALRIGLRNDGSYDYLPTLHVAPDGGPLTARIAATHHEPGSLDHPALRPELPIGHILDRTVRVGESAALAINLFGAFDLADDWSDSNAGIYGFEASLLDHAVSCEVEVRNPAPPRVALREIRVSERVAISGGESSIEVAFLLENAGGWVAVYEDAVPVELIGAVVETTNGRRVELGSVLSTASLPSPRLEPAERILLPGTIRLPPRTRPGTLTLTVRTADPDNVPPVRPEDPRSVDIELTR